jgi:polar amino acid transport system substrate-binding protein
MHFHFSRVDCSPFLYPRRLAHVMLFLSTLWTIQPLHAAEALPTPPRPLRVAATPMVPFILPGTTPPEGFSADVWKEVARRMHVDFAWQMVASDDRMPVVERGDADVVTGLIVMTPEAEQRVDFSQSYLDSGLRILVRPQGGGGFLDSFLSIPWKAIAELFGAAILILLLLANVVWFVERRTNPQFKKKYLAAIGEGLWGAMLIIATGEHGDRDEPRVMKRVIVATMWLLGVVLIAQLTATVTSSQTVARLQSQIHGPADLPGKTIAATPGTIAGDYLSGLGLPFKRMANPDEGVRMLKQGQVQAVIVSAAILEYLAAQPANSDLEVVGPVFRPYKIGFVVRTGSPLRKQINEALLAMYADGTYESIYAKWFKHGE